MDQLFFLPILPFIFIRMRVLSLYQYMSLGKFLDLLLYPEYESELISQFSSSMLTFFSK